MRKQFVTCCLTTPITNLFELLNRDTNIILKMDDIFFATTFINGSIKKIKLSELEEYFKDIQLEFNIILTNFQYLDII